MKVNFNGCNCSEAEKIEKIQTFKNGTKHLRQECKECGKFLGYKQQEVSLDYVLPYGKFKGSKLEDIPIDYLRWLYNDAGTKENLKEAIFKLSPEVEYTPQTVLEFGKYKNFMLVNCPHDYLSWLSNHGVNENLQSVIKEILYSPN